MEERMRKLDKAEPIEKAAAERTGVKARLFRVQVEVSFLVERDGEPLQVLTGSPISIMAADWPGFEINIEGLRQIAEAQAQRDHAGQNNPGLAGLMTAMGGGSPNGS